MSDTPIKLLVMDLDGTLLPHGGVISERTIAAIRAARKLGVITTISSGRNIPSFIEYARTAGVDGPLIGMQGAIARELPALGEAGSGALLRHVPFTSTLAARAVEWCRQHDLWGHVSFKTTTPLMQQTRTTKRIKGGLPATLLSASTLLRILCTIYEKSHKRSQK